MKVNSVYFLVKSILFLRLPFTSVNPFFLSQDYPNLTTFFEGEIISRRHPFLTRKWDASEEVDRKHWGKFAPFRPFMKTFNSDDFSYDQIDGTDFVFMRWKVSGRVTGNMSCTRYAVEFL